VDNVDANQFMHTISAVGHDQDTYKSTIPCLDHNSLEFYWIFKNMDFESWSSARSGELWLLAPQERNLDHVASYIIDQEKNSSNTRKHVLYFFCPTAVGSTALVNVFLHQLVRRLRPVDRKLVITVFLRTIIDKILARSDAPSEESWEIENCSSNLIIQQVVDKSTDQEHLEALKVILKLEQLDIEELCVIVAGLDEVVKIQNWDFVHDVLALVINLQERPRKVKVLLTSLPLHEFKVTLERLPSIEYDKERKGLMILPASILY